MLARRVLEFVPVRLAFVLRLFDVLVAVLALQVARIKRRQKLMSSLDPDRPPPDDVYGPIRRAWLACRKSRYEISDIAEDRSNALAALYREDETRRRRAEMTAARQVLSRPSSRASSHRIKGAIRRAALV